MLKCLGKYISQNFVPKVGKAQADMQMEHNFQVIQSEALVIP